MRITDLPLELFHEILRRSIETRGLKRGLRLRLVNSMCTEISRRPSPSNLLAELFAKESIQVIFVFQLLEDYLSTKCDNVALPAFAAAYLERRTNLWAAFHLWSEFVASRNGCAWKAKMGAAYKITSKSYLQW
jgi:hypothetical protein